MQKEILVNENLRETIKIYSKMAEYLKEMESNLLKEKNSLDWEVKGKAKINSEIEQIRKEIKEFHKLNIEISEYITFTLDNFKKVDQLMARKIDVMYKSIIDIMIKSIATSITGGFVKEIFNPKTYSNIKDWFNNMRNNAGSNDIDTGKSIGCGDPVNIATGNFITRKIDLNIGGYNPIAFSRFYNSIDNYKGSMGYGWHHSYEIFIEKKEEDIYIIVFSDGRIEEYTKDYKKFTTIPGNRNEFTYNSEEKRFELKYPEGKKLYFNAETLKLTSIIDSNNNETKLVYKNNLKFVNNECGSLEFKYNNEGLLEEIEDHSGRFIKYSYDDMLLTSITDVDGNISKYEYDKERRIHKIFGSDDKIKLINNYDKLGRTIEQITADGIKTIYNYDEQNSKNTFIEKNGMKVTYIKDDRNRIKETIYDNGSEKTVMDDNNRIIEKTDKNGNAYKYSYYENGNVKTEINPLGYKKIYEYNSLNKITKIIKSDGSLYKYMYDKKGNLVQVVDTLDRKTKMEYNEKGQVVVLIRPDKSKVIFEYDKKGNVVEVEDACGYISKFSYDKLNRVKTIVKPEGNTMAFKYTGKSKTTSIKMPDGNTIERKYNERDLLIEEKDIDDLVTYYKYDDMENLIEIRYPNGRIKGYEYNEIGNLSKEKRYDGNTIEYKYDQYGNIVEVIDPEGYRTRYKYDKVGNVIKSTDRRNNNKYFKYDALNRLIEIKNAKYKKTKYSFDLNGNLISILNALDYEYKNIYDTESQLKISQNPEGYKIEYNYDLMGRVKSVKNQKGAVTYYEYDKNGNLIKIIKPDKTVEKFEYNKNNKVVKYTNDIGHIVSYSYDIMERLERVTNVEGNSKFFKYDKKGRIIKVVDEKKNKTCYNYDIAGNLVEVIDANGHSIKYVYDILNNLSEVHRYGEMSDETINRMYEGVNTFKKPEEYITKYVYNKRDQIVKEINPSGFVTEYKYDEEANLVSKTDREGFNTTYEYDSLNNLKRIKYSDEKQVDYEYDDLNRVVSMTDWLGENKFELDSIGRITKLKDYKDRILEYGWSQTNEREYLIYPNGSKVDYKYDEMGKIKEVTGLDETTKYEYDSIGRIKKQILPNNIETNYEYEFSRLSKINSFRNGKIINNRKFEYDVLGNKTHIEANGEDTFYNYDNLNQLIEEKKPENTITKYFYDTLGNRARIEDWINTIKPDITEYSYDNNEHLIDIKGKRTNLFGCDEFLQNGVQMEYDKRGNLTKALTGSTTIAKLFFDETNKLSQFYDSYGKKNEFVYDGYARRVKSNSDDYLCDITKTYNSILQMNDSKYIYGNDISPIMEYSEGMNRYYINDELGSPVQIITDELNKESQEFDVFGETNGNNLFGFTSYQKDNSELLYGQARYYMPEIGRFISEDIIKGNLINPQSTNLTTYCTNNPLRFIDPSGNVPQPTPTPTPNTQPTPGPNPRPNKCGEFDNYQNEAIVISGNYYEGGGYSYGQFIDPSIKQIKDWKQEGRENITWIVVNDGRDIEDLKDTAAKLGVNIEIVNNQEEIFDYMNNGQDREKIQIDRMSIFSHGVPGELALGYSGKEELNINIEELQKANISDKAFTDDVYTEFYSCNAGTESGGTSFAQEWVDKIGGTAKGVKDGTTTYKHIHEGRSFSGTIHNWFERHGGVNYDESGSVNYPKASNGVEWYKYEKNSLPKKID
jgi:RHS repeat-associated protein